MKPKLASLDFKVGDRIRCLRWPGMLYTPGRIYHVVDLIYLQDKSPPVPIVVSDLDSQAGISEQHFRDGMFERLPEALVTDAGAAEYEEIMLTQEAVHGR